MTRVDRDKTRRINNLILDGIELVRSKADYEQKIKMYMDKFGVLSGEVRKIILNQNMDEMKLSVKYMFIWSIYKLTNSEKYNLDTFYNQENKLKFLHRYPANTQIPYARIFEKSKKYEESYKRDLSEFNISEIENILHELEPLTESASHVNGRIVTAYIDWCFENKITNVKSNELKDKSVEYFNKFVDKELELYFSKSTIDKIIRDCHNPQDGILIKLLFEGVQGKSLAEIRNIKKEHVINAENNNNVLIVYDEDDSKRKVRLEQSTIDLLKKAMAQVEYEKRNGDIEDTSIGILTNLVENDYVIRTSITRTDKENRAVDKMVIYRRIKVIGEVLGFPHLTAKNIVRSGVIYQASLKKELNKEDYLEICARFNIDNWYPVKKYCNPQIINKLYGAKNMLV